MALQITDECINCGVCEPECPNQAIFFADELDYFRIRAGRCTECVGSFDEPQCKKLCPIDGCIIVNPNRVETHEQLERKAKRIAINRALDSIYQQP